MSEGEIADMTMSEGEEVPLRRENEFESPGFRNPTPEEIEQILEANGGSRHPVGVNMVRLSGSIVARFGPRVSLQEVAALQSAAQSSTEIPIPKILGYYRYGPHERDVDEHGTLFDTYVFMDLAETSTSCGTGYSDDGRQRQPLVDGSCKLPGSTPPFSTR